MKRSQRMCSIFGGVLLLLLSSVAQAEILNLTTSGSAGYIADGLFSQSIVANTGTGNFQSILRLSDNTPTVSGYNTKRGTGADNTDASSPWTRLLRWNDLAATSIGGREYVEFALDVNQLNSAPLLSLDDFEIWVSPNATVGERSGWGTGADASMFRVYDLDLTADWCVYLDASLHAGSGYGDMFACVPTADFAGASNINYASNPYIYIYSSFGSEGGPTHANNDGFEEWAVDLSKPTPGIPEPSSFALLPMALAGLAFWRRKRS